MTVFDLIFIAAALTTVVTLISVVVAIVRRRRIQALRTLRTYGICAMVYMAASIAVAFARPQRVLSKGEDWCFDDWCLTVDDSRTIAAGPQTTYTVDFRVFSRARRVEQRALGAWIYLMDERGRMYSPESDATVAPLDVLLQPGESVATSRTFRVPADAQDLGLVTGHGGSYCGIGSILIIGEGGCLFNKPTMIRIR